MIFLHYHLFPTTCIIFVSMSTSLEESTDEEERLIIDENIENVDEVTFVTNKPIEDVGKRQHLLLEELIDEVCNTNTTVVNASRKEKGEIKESKNGFGNFKTSKKGKEKKSTENECGLSCEYEKEQTGWKNFKCIRAKLSTKDGEKLVLKEVDNKKKKRKCKDNSNNIITEKITMRKCDKRSIHPILPEDFVEAPCMMLGKKKVN